MYLGRAGSISKEKIYSHCPQKLIRSQKEVHKISKENESAID